MHWSGAGQSERPAGARCRLEGLARTEPGGERRSGNAVSSEDERPIDQSRQAHAVDLARLWASAARGLGQSHRAPAGRARRDLVVPRGRQRAMRWRAGYRSSRRSLGPTCRRSRSPGCSSFHMASCAHSPPPMVRRMVWRSGAVRRTQRVPCSPAAARTRATRSASWASVSTGRRTKSSPRRTSANMPFGSWWKCKKAGAAGKNPGPAFRQALDRSESGQQASQNGEVVRGGVAHGVTVCVEAAPVPGVGGGRKGDEHSRRHRWAVDHSALRK